MMFMLPLSFSNVHNAPHTNEIYKKATLLIRSIRSLGKLLSYLYNGLKMLYRLDQKVFCMAYLKKTLASVDKTIELKILLKDKTSD